MRINSILLIKPPITLRRNFKGIGRIYPPIGLGYLAAILEGAGYAVDILDASLEKWRKINTREDGIKYLGMDWKDIQSFVEKKQPDVVGLSVLSVDAFNASKTAEAVKKANENTIIIAGGPHVCVRPDSLSNVDVSIKGEGESVILKLMRDLKKNKRINNIQAKPVMNLDSIPFPAWHLMGLEKYFRAAKFLQGSRSIPRKGMSIITSRGCPYNCVFCSIRLSHGSVFRVRSPENVVEEMRMLTEGYGVEFISIEDDNFTLEPNRVKRICDLMIKNKLNITFGTPNGIRADTLSEKLLIKMQQAGCSGIIIAPESGSQHVVDNIIGKDLDLKRVEYVVKTCRKIRMFCSCFFVIGFPGETITDMKMTVVFAERMRSLDAMPFCFIATPYYGTRLYNISKKYGHMQEQDGSAFEYKLLNMDPMIETEDFTKQDLLYYRSLIRSEPETTEIINLLKKRPLDTLRCFSTHPALITKYIARRMLT